jgi:hypothetical protein
VGQAPEAQPQRRWPMYGNDPGRRSCLNCDDFVTTSSPLAGGPERLRFAAPWPNPASAGVRLSYALPAAAAVRIDVFDVNGRRVRSVLRTEQAAGTHSTVFDGIDGDGRAVDAGLYFARLEVRGPGVRGSQTRRFTIVR